MILDKLTNAQIYFNLNERISVALKYLQAADLVNIQPGRHSIDGDNIYALVSDYQTKSLSSKKPEAHKKYIDVQYVASGEELLGIRSLKDEIPSVPYDEEKDIMFFDEETSLVKFESGMFAILYPQDIHMPGIEILTPEPVRKIVIKVKI